MKQINRKIHTIDATGKSPGRLAVEIARILRGKHKVDFSPHKDEGDVVVVENVEKMKITGKKLDTKIYYRHTGYPGGLKETPMRKIFEKDPGEVLKRAVWGMLPKNKLRARMIKRLKIKK
jgi:large subunit ribosomal protein L13